MRSLLKEFQVLKWNQRKMAQESSFRVKCVLTNTLLAWGMEAFANLLEEMNRTEEAYELREKIDRIWHSLLRYCWNERDGLFYNLEMKKDGYEQVRINTISSLLPLLLDIPAEIKDRLVEHITDTTEYWSKYPIPTVAMTEKSFDPSNNSLLWRGPTWVNTNFFIWLGLKKHKEAKLANELAKRTHDLIQKSGFWEFYNPLSGNGGGAKNFGWSTLVLLMEEDIEILFR
jgi:glycogen debranching enzyme